MKVQIRLPAQLLAEIRRDLARPHGSAFERIGFIFAKTSQLDGDSLLVLMSRYFQIRDNEYVADDEVGAKIGSAAIRRVLQESIDSGEGAFHVHLHDFSARPEFSGIDRESAALLMPSFQVVTPGAIHGAFLIGSRECIADVWVPGAVGARRADRVSAVGYPLGIYRGKHERRAL